MTLAVFLKVKILTLPLLNLSIMKGMPSIPVSKVKSLVHSPRLQVRPLQLTE
jgi:hypothetical protein